MASSPAFPASVAVLVQSGSVSMAHVEQERLRAAWLDAPRGCLSAWSQARAWALRECWREAKESEYGMLAVIAGKVGKSGGGQPSPQAAASGGSAMTASACERLQSSGCKWVHCSGRKWLQVALCLGECGRKCAVCVVL